MVSLRGLLALSILAAVLAGCVEPDQPALDYGKVLQVRAVDAPGENTGLGAVAGAGAGGLIGSRLGGGSGNVAATVAGIVVGAVAGAATEGALQNSSGLEYTVALDNGQLRTIVQHRNADDPILEPGARVVIHTSGRFERVEPADVALQGKP